MTTAHYAQCDEAGWLISVYEVTDPEGAIEGLVLLEAWSGWPVPPADGQRLRRVSGELVWQDPRTSEQQATDARARRDAELAASDWVVTRAMERDEAMPTAWAVYRQALRDVPEQTGFPASLTWPDPPE